MSFKIDRWILISVAIHAVIYLSFFSRPAAVFEPAFVPIELSALKGLSEVTAKEKSGSTSPSAAGTPVEKNGLRGLMLTEEGDRAIGSGQPGVLGSLSLSVLHEHLYRRIDQALEYPREFAERGIEGLVKAEIEISKTDSGVQTFYRVTASSPYLRVYIRRVLREILSAGIPSPYVPVSSTMRVYCSFDFELTGRETAWDQSKTDVVAASQNGIHGDHYNFYRAAKMIGQWKLGPLGGYAFLPAVGVDLNWFEEQFSGSGNRPVVDPLAKYRSAPDWASD